MLRRDVRQRRQRLGTGRGEVIGGSARGHARGP
jgi:hypothetical protein